MERNDLFWVMALEAERNRLLWVWSVLYRLV